MIGKGDSTLHTDTAQDLLEIMQPGLFPATLLYQLLYLLLYSLPIHKLLN